ncbi:MAG: GNAT family N-acetyltransferase [Candidatus Binataceae bacterium]
MEEMRRTPRTIVKRMAKRAAYDRETIYSILDRALVCHVGFVADGAPSVLPTLHARIDDRLYLHGSAASHMLRTAADGAEICVTVTMIDGLVLARSAFHHSVNYRSAVIFGRAARVEERKQKLAAMRALVEHVAPGRWAGTRAPNEKEIAGTLILELPIEETSAKVRTGGPIDDEADYALPFWAGVIPLALAAFAPIADPRMGGSISIPPHVFDYRTPDERAPGLAHDGAPFEQRVGGFLVTTDVSRLDLNVIHRFLTGSYWAAEIPRHVVARALKNSLCFGLYDCDEQIGLARVVTDYATFAYVADVFVLEGYRGRGLSKALMAAALAHPHLQGLRRWTLATRDAHGLYRKFGFETPPFPDRLMERADLEVYRRRSADAK